MLAVRVALLGPVAWAVKRAWAAQADSAAETAPQNSGCAYRAISRRWTTFPPRSSRSVTTASTAIWGSSAFAYPARTAIPRMPCGVAPRARHSAIHRLITVRLCQVPTPMNRPANSRAPISDTSAVFATRRASRRRVSTTRRFHRLRRPVGTLDSTGHAHSPRNSRRRPFLLAYASRRAWARCT